MLQLADKSQQYTICCKCLHKLGCLQHSGMTKSFQQTWDCGTAVQPVQTSPQTIVPLVVEQVLQYFMENPQSDYMPVLLAGQRKPKATLQLVVPALVQQDLLLQCKPLVDWLKASVVHDGTSYALGVNPDSALLAVDNALMDHRMMFHKSDISGRWAPQPSTQAIVTGSDALIAQELGTIRRAQEEVVADKKETPKKRWGVEQVTKLLRLARVLSESGVPPIYTALRAGRGASQDRIILQNAFVVCSLEAGAATTTAPIVTPAFALDIGAVVFAGVSIESYGQGASIFSAASGGAEKLAEEQLNAARAWDLGASASTMSVADLQAAACRLPPQDCPTNVTAVLHFGPDGPQHWYGRPTRGSPLKRQPHSVRMSQGCRIWSL